MRIAMVSAEANPLCKSGGLADVVYSLSKELVRCGHETIVILPFYGSIKEKGIPDIKYLGEWPLQFSWRSSSVKLCELYRDGIRYILVENDQYFYRGAMYGFQDDNERFAYFTLAARAAFGILGFSPDIIHIHDWQPGMLPVLIKKQNANDPLLSKAKFVLTIHNPAFKGYMDRYYLNDFYGLSDELYDNGDVRFEGMVSSLKAAMVYSEKITTVSPTHRGELLSEGLSQGFNGVLRMREADFVGIVNGLDTDEFNPNNDPLIPATYNLRSFKGKSACRKALLEACNMQDTGAPIFGLVSRLTWQKGVDLVVGQARGIIERGGYVIIVGSGEFDAEVALNGLANEFPNQCYVYCGYSNKWAHLVYAGSDFFLMPSLFEPCGIGQMIAERYGCLPIARDTGGLHDTIVHFNWNNENEATGYLFPDYSQHSFYLAIDSAEKTYSFPKLFRQLQKNAMKADHSWKKSTEEYLNLYSSIL